VRRRVLPAAALAAGAALAACLEISRPPTGLSSISPIQVPWPAVVVGDALRDSTGETAALVVEAFDGSGEPATDAQILFIVLDRGLHVTPAGVVIGDSTRTSPVRIVAQVSREGDLLQTPEVGIDVVPLPDSVAPARAETTFTAKPIPVADPDPISSDELKVKVIHRGTGGTDTTAVVRSWIVRYEIVEEPPSGVEGENTAVFVGAADTLRMIADTTDGTGTASRTISLRRVFLLSSEGTQTVKVLATIRRIGAANETRTVLFLLPFVPE
jgi:hypothetical protein